MIVFSEGFDLREKLNEKSTRGGNRGRRPDGPMVSPRQRESSHSSQGSDDGNRMVEEQNDSLVVKIENEFASSMPRRSPRGAKGQVGSGRIPQRWGGEKDQQEGSVSDRGGKRGRGRGEYGDRGERGRGDWPDRGGRGERSEGGRAGWTDRGGRGDWAERGRGERGDRGRGGRGGARGGRGANADRGGRGGRSAKKKVIFDDFPMMVTIETGDGPGTSDPPNGDNGEEYHAEAPAPVPVRPCQPQESSPSTESKDQEGSAVEFQDLEGEEDHYDEQYDENDDDQWEDAETSEEMYTTSEGSAAPVQGATEEAVENNDIHNSSAESLERFIQEHTLKLDIKSGGCRVTTEADGVTSPGSEVLSPLSADSIMKTPTGHVRVPDWGAEMEDYQSDSNS